MPLGVLAQQPRADGVERSRPASRSVAAAALARARPLQDAVDPPRHLRGGAAREGQQQDAVRVGAVHDQDARRDARA